MAEGPEKLTGSLQHFGLARDRMRAALARHVGVSATDLDALEHLEGDGPLTQRDLGDRLALTSGAVTMLVDRLEQAGWVFRRKHPTDRRYVLIELSPAALDAVPDGLADYHRKIANLAKGIPEAHRKLISGFLNETADAAAEAARVLHRPKEPSAG